MLQDMVESRGNLWSTIQGFRTTSFRTWPWNWGEFQVAFCGRLRGLETRARTMHAAVLTLANFSGLPHVTVRPDSPGLLRLWYRPAAPCVPWGLPAQAHPLSFPNSPLSEARTSASGNLVRTGRAKGCARTRAALWTISLLDSTPTIVAASWSMCSLQCFVKLLTRGSAAAQGGLRMNAVGLPPSLSSWPQSRTSVAGSVRAPYRMCLVAHRKCTFLELGVALSIVYPMLTMVYLQPTRGKPLQERMKPSHWISR